MNFIQLWNNSVLNEKQSMAEFVNHTVSSLKGCRPQDGAGGCKTNNTCNNTWPCCLSCVFTTVQYSSLDFNDLYNREV